MKKFTLKKAKDLSILKWEELAETGAKRPSEKVMDQLKDLAGYCGFCERQRRTVGDHCRGCTLAAQDSGLCCGGLWFAWHCAESSSERKEYAKQILAFIRKVKVPIWERLFS